MSNMKKGFGVRYDLLLQPTIVHIVALAEFPFFEHGCWRGSLD